MNSTDQAGAGLWAQLMQAPTNRDRAEHVAEFLLDHHGLPLKRGWRLQSDVAAVARMMPTLTDPTKVLRDVSGYVESSLRRMYRCRNMIVHGGTTRGDVLDSTVRVVAPLVGAALDRLVHSHMVVGTEPLDLATRADAAISLVSEPAVGLHVVDVLGNT